MAIAAGIVLLWHGRDFFHDDAFISLRYVRRLLAGQGLTWNTGERVEGFTHPLWLAQIAVLGHLGVDLPLASRLLGWMYFGALLALWGIARATPLFLLVAATLPGLVTWTASGLETTSFAVWLALGALLAQETLWQAQRRSTAAGRYAALAGVALAAAALTRPEGAGAGLLALAALAFARQWPATGAMLATFLLCIAPYQLFRLVYYGDFVPNTAYAKLSGLALAETLPRGLQYVWHSSVPAAGAAVVGLVLTRGARTPWIMLIVAAPVFLSALLAGGDHMPAGRLVTPGVLVLVLAAAVAGREGRYRYPAIVLTVVAWTVLSQFAFTMTGSLRRDPAAAMGEPVGRWLEAHLPAGTVVATATAGSTPYHAPSLTFIDTLGLNDRHIARRRVSSLETTWQRVPGHLRGDGAYVLERAPDVVILGPALGYDGADPRQWFLTDFELLQSEEFRQRYRPYRFLVPTTLAEGRIPALKSRLDARQMLPFTAYLRTDSAQASTLVALGEPLEPSADRPPP